DYKEQERSPGASQPGHCTPQMSPVEYSQLVSAQSQKMPTRNQTVLTSAYCSMPERASTQNSRAHPGTAIGFHCVESSETVSVNQHVLCADQTLWPAGAQLIELEDTQDICLPNAQRSAIPDTQNTVQEEGCWMKTLSANNTLVTFSTAQNESQRITLGDSQVALCGRPADQSPNEDHRMAWACDQTFSGDMGMPVNGDHTSYSQVKTRNGGQVLYESQMTAPSCNQNLQPSGIITFFSDQAHFGDEQRSPVADELFYGDQMIAHNGHQALFEPQMTDTCDQVDYSGLMTSSTGQNVYRGQTQGGEYTLCGYQASGDRDGQNVPVDSQMTRLNGGQAPCDLQMPNPGLSPALHGSKWANPSTVENLSLQYLQTTSPCEQPFYWSQMKTSVHQKFHPDQKGPANVEESLEPQMMSLSSQCPYVGGSPHPSSSLLAQRQPLESFSASPSVQRQLPQTESDLHTQGHGTQVKADSLKIFSCLYQGCGKTYTKSHHLLDHRRKHTGEKPYVCNKPGCPWKFFRSSDLRRHQRKHSGERTYPCAKCNKNFSRVAYLKQHERVHTQASSSTGN
ncbi:Kruppel-like factor 18, partial [Psammomys obesus]|uniref:Kruppel-like factor 18 n=1 Tax=Psammomys obesus TaxID=48139 RepID=UPI0024531E4B